MPETGVIKGLVPLQGYFRIPPGLRSIQYDRPDVGVKDLQLCGNALVLGCPYVFMHRKSVLALPILYLMSESVSPSL